MRNLTKEELNDFLERKYKSLLVEKPKKVRLILSGAKVERKARVKKAKASSSPKEKKRPSAKQIRQESTELSLLKDLGLDL
jgi:hypothetical protein